MKKLKLRCYCCGEKLGDTFVLVSMGAEDRVFVMLPAHYVRADFVSSQFVKRIAHAERAEGA